MSRDDQDLLLEHMTWQEAKAAQEAFFPSDNAIVFGPRGSESAWRLSPGRKPP